MAALSCALLHMSGESESPSASAQHDLCTLRQFRCDDMDKSAVLRQQLCDAVRLDKTAEERKQVSDALDVTIAKYYNECTDVCSVETLHTALSRLQQRVRALCRNVTCDAHGEVISLLVDLAVNHLVHIDVIERRRQTSVPFALSNISLRHSCASICTETTKHKSANNRNTYDTETTFITDGASVKEDVAPLSSHPIDLAPAAEQLSSSHSNINSDSSNDSSSSAVIYLFPSVQMRWQAALNMIEDMDSSSRGRRSRLSRAYTPISAEMASNENNEPSDRGGVNVQGEDLAVTGKAMRRCDIEDANVCMASVDVMIYVLAELQQWAQEQQQEQVKDSQKVTAAWGRQASPGSHALMGESSMRLLLLDAESMMSMYGLGVCQHILWWNRHLERICARAGMLRSECVCNCSCSSAHADMARNERLQHIHRKGGECCMPTDAAPDWHSSSLPLYRCVLSQDAYSSCGASSSALPTSPIDSEEEDVVENTTAIVHDLVRSASRLFLHSLYYGVIEPSVQVIASRCIHILLFDIFHDEHRPGPSNGQHSSDGGAGPLHSELSTLSTCVKNMVGWCASHLGGHVPRDSNYQDKEQQALEEGNNSDAAAKPVQSLSAGVEMKPLMQTASAGDGAIRLVLHNALMPVLDVAMERADTLLAEVDTAPRWDWPDPTVEDRDAETAADEMAHGTAATDATSKAQATVPPMRIRLSLLLDAVASVHPCSGILSEDSAYVTLRRFSA